jgi:hypothetical protein
MAVAVNIAQDMHRQSEARQADLQKKQLALAARLELGHAVQDFKDCLLRAESFDCEEFYVHIEAIDRTASAYATQGVQLAYESETLATLGRALIAYRSALDVVREMHNSHASIKEIDDAVRGADRPVARELRKLSFAPGPGHSPRVVPVGQLLLMVISALLAAALLAPTVRYALRARKRSNESAQLLRQLSNRMMAWEEEKKAKAFAHLHDGVCQSLSGIMYFLKSAQHVTPGEQRLPGALPSSCDHEECKRLACSLH